jgi:hypothetical protein
VTLRRADRNETLRALLEETRWTNHNFAQAVNRVAAESGTSLHYDRTSVSHWLSGSRPRRPVPAFVAEACTRRLGRLISIADTGLGDQDATDVLLPPEEDCGVTSVLHLVAADLDPARRMALQELPYRTEWAAIPDWASLQDEAEPAGASARTDGTAALEAIRAMTDAFARADRAFGGGHARVALVAYLATDIAAWLRADAPKSACQELLGAAAQLTYLIGFMCFDSLHHDLAQRYFRAALRLATEAGDPIGHAKVLRGMSMQAWFLGHHWHAAHLAEAAVQRVNGLAPPEARAALLGQAAVSHAALSHQRVAMSYLAEAEKHLGNAERGCETVDCGAWADLAHQTGRVLTSFHDHHGAEIALRDSLEHRASSDRRSRMITTHHLAELQLRRGQPELACITWQRFLTDYRYVQSARVRRALVAFCERLRLHERNPVVQRTLYNATRLYNQ